MAAAVNYADPYDPVYIGEDSAPIGANTLVTDGRWLFSGGTRASSVWVPAPPICGGLSAGLAGDRDSSTISAQHLFDPALTRSYRVAGNVHDLAVYGDYLLAAVGDQGLVILHRDRPEQTTRLELGNTLQGVAGRGNRLHLFGNVLLVAGGTGVVAVDIHEPLAPQVISAGNQEAVAALDIYRERIVAVAPDQAMTVFELPGAVVLEASLPEGALIASDEGLELQFNEPITEVSLAAVSVQRVGGEAVPVTVTPLGDGEDAYSRYRFEFPREPGATYQLRIDEARNQRGGALWRPFVTHLTAAPANAQRPVIEWVENGLARRGDYADIEIHGAGFRNSAELQAYIGPYALDPVWVDENTLRLPAGSLEMLPLQLGEHHLRVVDGGLTAALPGAIVLVEAADLVDFEQSTDTAGTQGGAVVAIRSNTPAILPGTKIVLRSPSGEEIRTEEVAAGTYISDLKDNVVSLDEFRFRAPGVTAPELYRLYLVHGSDELYVGNLSYTMSEGRSIDLPNYPPMVVGAAESRGDILFVGVKDGPEPSAENRFLMPSGLEIYDIAVWGRPVRLAQMRTEQPVTGLVSQGGALYLASGSDGLLVVDVHDLSRPLLVHKLPVPGNIASDLDLHRGRGILALAAHNDLGTGFVRFFAVSDPALDPPAGYSTLAFAEDELRGRPLDVAWRGDALYVLFAQDGALKLAIFEDLGGEQRYRVQTVARGAVSKLDSVSMLVQHGQVVVTSGDQYLVLHRDADGHYDTAYWQSLGSASNALFANVGGVFVGGGRGATVMPTPRLAVTSIEPPSGSELASSDRIRVQLSQLFNTEAEALAAALTLRQADGSALPSDAYTLEGINTLAGGYIDIRFTEALTYEGGLTLQVGTELRALNGEPLTVAVSADYTLIDGQRPRIEGVARIRDGEPGLHYFHADGNEQAVVFGAGFGSDPDSLRLWVGDEAIPAAAISGVADDAIYFDLPRLRLPTASASLSLTVERGGIAAVSPGALVVLPRVSIEDIDPASGPPQGGNFVDIRGRGFSHATTVHFGSAQVGDLRLLSSNHLRVRVPAGDFGYTDVIAGSELFPDEQDVYRDGYFYAGRETGSVDLSAGDHRSSPVTAIALGDQIVYAVTGGGYELVDRTGKVVGYPTTSRAQLVVADISDPVRPDVVYRQFADLEQPYHLDETLPPDGFRDIVLDERDLYLLGGDRLYHFDITLAAEPLLLSVEQLPALGNRLAVADGLIYVSGDDGLAVYRRDVERRLQQIVRIDRERLGGTPGALQVSGRHLTVALTDAQEILRLDLTGGDFAVAERFASVDRAGYAFAAEDILVRGDRVLASSGRSAKVVLYALQPNERTAAVAELPLAYLLRNGDIFAGRLQLAGQTLYVAAGEGDVQLFDISPWLDGQYQRAVQLQHYFSVTGAVNALAFGGDAIYAGTAYIYVDGQPTGNPIASAVAAGSLGGGLNTIVNDQLVIVDQTPQPMATHPIDQAVAVQFNRILDPEQLRDVADRLLEVSLSGAPIPGYVSSQVNNTGTRLYFRPASDFQDGRRYRVRVSQAVRDLHGNTLPAEYSFRFDAAADAQPAIERLEPVHGSWRGGDEIRLLGTGFTGGTEIVLGGQAVDPAAIVSLTADEVRFRLPRLDSRPTDNRLVGLEVRNGAMSDFRAGAFTYVAEPSIEQIGTFEPLADGFNPYQHRLLYQSDQRVAIVGEGLGPMTRITANGLPVRDVRLEGADMLSFLLPENLLGPVSLEVGNMHNGLDAISNDSLSVGLGPVSQLRGVRASDRAGDLLLVAGSTPELYTTRDGAAPVFLSVLEWDGAGVAALALSQDYALMATTAAELLVYDLSNVYAPKRLHRFSNPSGKAFQRLALSGSAIVADDGEQILLGRIGGEEWQVLTDSVIDFGVQEQMLYLLTDFTLEVRHLHTPETIVAELYHSVINPQALQLSPQRLLLHGASNLQLYDTGRVPHGGELRALGVRSIGGMTSAVLNGELLAVHRSDRSLMLYDVRPALELGEDLRLATVAEVFIDDTAPERLRFQRNLLEWGAAQQYHNVRVPVANVLGPVPGVRIGADDEQVALAVTGAPAAWSQVLLDVIREEDDYRMTGESRLLGEQLQLLLGADRYTAQSGYRVALFNPPADVVQGVEIDYAMPWYLQAADVFGLEPLALSGLRPGTTISNRLTEFTVYGSGLHQAEQLRLGGLQLEPAQWTVNDAGSELRFSAAVPEAGLHALRVTQAGQTEVLPAAVFVGQALELHTVSTDHAEAADRVSEAGGTQVSVTGLGFEGELSVHWLEHGAGFVPSDNNRVSFRKTAEGLVFSAPAVEHGVQYQVVVRKPATGEEVTAAELLTGIDDVPPRLITTQRLGYVEPLRLTFDEPMMADHLQVIAVVQDYSGAEPLDVSDRFELRVTGNIVEARLRSGALEHNRIYQLVIDGLADRQGNLPVQRADLNNGRYEHEFVSQDVLPPRELALSLDGNPLTAATQLTRGRSYTFQPSAEDNRDPAEALRFSARVSTNGGISFGPYQSLNQGLVYHAQESDGQFAVILRAEDRAGNYAEQRFDAAVVDPEIHVSPVYTAPELVEEMSRADIRFDISGDGDLITRAELRVFDTWYPLAVDFDPNTRTATTSLSYLHPKLADIEPSDQVPVRLHLEYGFAGTRQVDDSYTLHLDVTPPTLQIVTPGDGDRVLLDEPLDVIFQAFDRYGIDRIEVAVNGGGWEATARPDRFTYTPTSTDPLTIAARAWDPNENVSDVKTITVQPYDASLGEPAVDILAPANGAEFYEGEAVEFELMMRNVPQAELYFDVGGVESEEPVTTLTRSLEETTRFAHSERLPIINDSAVVVVRLEVDGLRARRFLNVLRNDGIDAEPTLKLLPATSVLGGTELWVQAARPEACRRLPTVRPCWYAIRPPACR
ncbi:hypothetical protein CAL65_20010 [Alkalilimnicola ehrlichii]|uniref:SbsA Ig-like domain-containing protein n=1 Tax=Alkalilimnicola ehrlichii TaxID=351052 RepID=A0A3E0WHQ4_9GAMM|nr:hypothetical protein CAL65_20010 [Alkalilimnicola ehrlichii]